MEGDNIMGRRLGILTFHWSNHFGAVLQAWALNKLLFDMGYDVEIINFIPSSALIASRSWKPSEHVQAYQALGINPEKVFIHSLGRTIKHVYSLKSDWLKKHSFRYFREHFITVSPKALHSVSELRNECSKYNICLVGSDQVWNPTFLRYSDFAYLLPFRLKGVNKVAFSVSIAENVPQNLLKTYKLALSEFSFISLRERVHCQFLRSLLQREIFHTLDPTLLLSRESYEALSNKNPKLIHEKYVLLYNIDPSILPFVNYFVRIFKLPIVAYIKQPLLLKLRKPNLSRCSDETYFFSSAGPGEFIDILRNAEFVITNSFHGTALSILFEKPFMTIISGLAVKGKSRLFDLLELCKLKSRLFEFGSTSPEKIVREPIDYVHVKEFLDSHKRNSLKALEVALRN